jgi:hypothetical protein
MPRKAKGDPPNDSLPDDNRGENQNEPPLEDYSGMPDASGEVITGGPPINRMDPSPDRIAREDKMAAKGELPWIRLQCKRVTPDKVKHPTTGMFIPSSNQMKKFEGQFTEAEVETKVHDYFGGGTIIATAFDPSNSMRYMWRRTYEFAGEPNVSNVLGDCMTTQLAESMGLGAAAAPGTLSPSPLVPGPLMAHVAPDPVKQIENEAKLMEAEARKMEVEAEAQGRKARAQRRIRALERETKQEEEEERFQEDGFAFEGPGRPMPLALRRGAFRGFPPQEPIDEMDRPITSKDMMLREQMQQLRDQNRDLAAKLDRTVEKLGEQNSRPKGETAALVVAIAGALAPLASKMMEISSQGRADARQSQDNLLKLGIEGGNKSDKQMELIMQAMGLKDQRDSNSIEQYTELIRLGGELAGSGGGEESTFEKVARAAGDVLGGVVQAFQSRGPAPQVVQQQIPAQVPRPALPMPGQATGQAQPRPLAPAALPVLPPQTMTVAPRAAPQPQGEGGRAVPPVAAPTANPNPEEEGQGMTDAELAKLAEQILDSAVAESKEKPEQAKWIEVAFKGMPDEWIEAVANAESYNDLIELVKPYVPMMKLLGLIPVFQGDPGIRPWLEKGFVVLQEACKNEMAKPAGEAPETEPVVEEDFGGEEQA